MVICTCTVLVTSPPQLVSRELKVFSTHKHKFPVYTQIAGQAHKQRSTQAICGVTCTCTVGSEHQRRIYSIYTCTMDKARSHMDLHNNRLSMCVLSSLPSLAKTMTNIPRE